MPLGEPPVDAPHELLDRRAEVVVLTYLAPARHRQLHERDRSRRCGIQLEQALDGPQSMRDSLRVVEPVDAQQDGPPFEAAPEPRDVALDVGCARRLREPGRVDRDRVRAKLDESTVCRAQPAAFDSESLVRCEARAPEVVAVRGGVERDHVGARASPRAAAPSTGSA